jgi:threonine dehydrogenase-like Zn-dependent dehydrogenase
MAPPGAFYERGILGAHGYIAEHFTSKPEYLVSVSASRAEYGFFAEPVSIVEKALDQAGAARSAFDWQPSSAFVLRNDNLGLIALARLEMGDEFDRVYCLGRRDRPDPTIEFIEQTGRIYVDSRETALSEVPEVHESADFIFETISYPNHAIDAVSTLGPNGIATFQGIPGDAMFEIDSGAFHSDLVVNSRRSPFRAAVKWLTDTPNSGIDDLISGIYGVDEVEQAFADPREAIKTVISFEQ